MNKFDREIGQMQRSRDSVHQELLDSIRVLSLASLERPTSPQQGPPRPHGVPQAQPAAPPAGRPQPHLHQLRPGVGRAGLPPAVSCWLRGRVRGGAERAGGRNRGMG